MTIHNKLVRDKILDVLDADKLEYSSRILDGDEYGRYLKEKLKEEVDEYLNANSNRNAIEELADILEVIRALAKMHGGDYHIVESVRGEKETKRGGFEKGIFLIEVKD